MKAITISEPWASMIAHGFKTMETRSWPTKYRGRIAIHAGKGKMPSENIPEMIEMLDGDTHPGCIVAYADIIDCIEITDDIIEQVKENHAEYISGFYSPGRYAFILDNVEQIEPIQMKGRQRIWNV